MSGARRIKEDSINHHASIAATPPIRSAGDAALAGETNEHATNPLIASYDIIDFLTTIAFVGANLATSLDPLVPMISNVLHILNYALLGYIQAKGLVTLDQQHAIDEIHAMDGTIGDDEEFADAKSAILPPKKGRKSSAEFTFDFIMYILKMMVCLFLVTISIISTAVVTGAVATLINAAFFPIAYVMTTAINLLKFGKNTIKGIYDYFKSDHNNESAYKRHHNTVNQFHCVLKRDLLHNAVVTREKLNEYLDARNAINQTGRDTIQNSIFLALNTVFFAGSILFVLSSSALVTAALPPLAVTIASALFVGAGIIFAAHGLSVLANVIRKKRGLPEKETMFEWLAQKFYPTVTADDLVKKGYKFTVVNRREVVNDHIIAEQNVEETPDDKPELKPLAAAPANKKYSLYPYSSNGFAGGLFSNSKDPISFSAHQGVLTPKSWA